MEWYGQGKTEVFEETPVPTNLSTISLIWLSLRLILGYRSKKPAKIGVNHCAATEDEN
jgi:hypothetical protein